MRGAAAAASLLALALAASPASGAPAPDALGAVRRTLDRASAIMAGSAGRNEKIASLHDVARELLDTRTMGRRVLGRRLAEEPEANQEEFLDLFAELIVRAWLQRLLLFEDPEFEYVGQTADPQHPLVRTRIRTAVDAYSIDYEMHRSEGGAGWQATDIQVEGISLLRNYHSQFRRLLEHQSFEEVLSRMQRKVKVLGEGPS